MHKAVENTKWIFFIIDIFVLNFIDACDLTIWNVDTARYRLTFYDVNGHDWNEANAVCGRMGSTMVQMDKDQVRRAVYDNLSSSKCVIFFWIGAKRSCITCDNWLWVDGSFVDMYYIGWAVNQPDNHNGVEDKMVIWNTSNKYSDVRGNFNAGIICQDVRTPTPWRVATPRYYVTFYNIAAENWDDAVATCSWIGATMVQLDDVDVREAVYKNVAKAPFIISHFWIGAKRACSTCENWKWMDGTPVDMNLIEWAENGQPDNYRGIEDKLIIRVDNNKFADIPEVHEYAATICQEPRDEYCVEYPETCENGGVCISTPYLNPYYQCECTGSGYYGKICAVTYCDFYLGTCKNGGICTSTPETFPYYECDCTDTGLYGPQCTERFAAPTIQNIKSDECSMTGEITVLWVAYESVVSYRHRCTATPMNDTEPVGDPVDVYPTIGIVQNTKFVNLKIATLYKITITACPYDTCFTELTSHGSIATGFGLPEKVLEPIVNKIHNSLCNVTWEWPSNVPHDLILGFQISTTLTYVYGPENTRIRNANLQSKRGEADSIYAVFLELNREYSFEVAARTCVGIGPSVAAIGKCVSDFAAPNEIALPEDVEQNPSTTRKVQITMPDETNGPVSCMFVVAKSGPIELSEQVFDIAKLQRLSTQASGDEMPKKTEYLAAAIPRSNVTEESFTIHLGDQGVSRCDVSEVDSVGRNSKKHFTAINWRLGIGLQYHYYIVTSTSTASGITKFQQSPANSFQNGTPDVTETSMRMIGLMIGITVALIVTVAVIFIVKNKRRDNFHQNKNKSGENGKYTRDGGIYFTASSYHLAMISDTNAQDSKKDNSTDKIPSAYALENLGAQMDDEDNL